MVWNGNFKANVNIIFSISRVYCSNPTLVDAQATGIEHTKNGPRPLLHTTMESLVTGAASFISWQDITAVESRSQMSCDILSTYGVTVWDLGPTLPFNKTGTLGAERPQSASQHTRRSTAEVWTARCCRPEVLMCKETSGAALPR
jgi:hypothetical protein